MPAARHRGAVGCRLLATGLPRLNEIDCSLRGSDVPGSSRPLYLARADFEVFTGDVGDESDQCRVSQLNLRFGPIERRLN
jgi:hypothetical protein